MNELSKSWVVKMTMPRKRPFDKISDREVITANFQGTDAEINKLGYMLGFCSAGTCIIEMLEVE